MYDFCLMNIGRYQIYCNNDRIIITQNIGIVGELTKSIIQISSTTHIISSTGWSHNTVIIPQFPASGSLSPSLDPHFLVLSPSPSLDPHFLVLPHSPSLDLHFLVLSHRPYKLQN